MLLFTNIFQKEIPAQMSRGFHYSSVTSAAVFSAKGFIVEKQSNAINC